LDGVIERLLAKGIKVTAPANPLRGIAHDSAYAASILAQTPGRSGCRPFLWRRGDHERRDPGPKRRRPCFFVAAFAPDEGETLGEVEANSKDSVLNSALVPQHYPTDGGTAVELAIAAPKLGEAFAADLPAEQAALLAATQRPVAEAAFSEPSGPPAWKHLPSWTVLATGDKAAGADVVRAQAQRAGATITEVEGSRVIMISQPQAVTDVILGALAALTAPAGTS
jgi:hypothetical protein